MNASGSAMMLAGLDDVDVGPNFWSDSHLLSFVRRDLVRVVDPVYSSSVPDCIATATVIWPGFAEGRVTTIVNETHRVVDGFTLTYPNRARQIRQPPVTRNEAGEITHTPDLIIEDWVIQ